jgi:transcriptional regulator with XRE-family HTH domain
MDDPASTLQNAAEAAVRIRIERGFDIETAARNAGIDVERLEAFEDGDEALAIEELDRLAATYGVTTNEFFGAHWTPLQNYAGG